MLTTEIHKDVFGGRVALIARWLRVPAAVSYSGIRRARLYELLAEGRIRSVCLRASKDKLRGIRLIDRESIDAFMLQLPPGIEQSERPALSQDEQALDPALSQEPAAARKVVEW